MFKNRVNFLWAESEGKSFTNFQNVSNLKYITSQYRTNYIVFQKTKLILDFGDNEDYVGESIKYCMAIHI